MGKSRPPFRSDFLRRTSKTKKKKRKPAEQQPQEKQQQPDLRTVLNRRQTTTTMTTSTAPSKRAMRKRRMPKVSILPSTIGLVVKAEKTNLFDRDFRNTLLPLKKEPSSPPSSPPRRRIERSRSPPLPSPPRRRIERSVSPPPHPPVSPPRRRRRRPSEDPVLLSPVKRKKKHRKKRDNDKEEEEDRTRKRRKRREKEDDDKGREEARKRRHCSREKRLRRRQSCSRPSSPLPTNTSRRDSQSSSSGSRRRSRQKTIDSGISSTKESDQHHPSTSREEEAVEDNDCHELSLNHMVVLDAVGVDGDCGSNAKEKSSSKGEQRSRESSLSLSSLSPSPERVPATTPPRLPSPSSPRPRSSSRPSSRRSRHSPSAGRGGRASPDRHHHNNRSRRGSRQSRSPPPTAHSPPHFPPRKRRLSPARPSPPPRQRHRRSPEFVRRRRMSGEGRSPMGMRRDIRTSSGTYDRHTPVYREDSWDSKVSAFMQTLESKEASSTSALNGVLQPAAQEIEDSGQPSNPPPPGVELNEEEVAAEDLKATPLVRYVGKKLSSAKGTRQTKLRLEGVFQFNLLSLLTRAEWVAAKSIQLLEEAGYNENSLYFIATNKGGTALETELKTAVFKGKVNLGGKSELVAQVLRVIEYIVQYFTSPDGKESSGDEGGEDPGAANVADKETAKDVVDAVSSAGTGRPVRAGVGDLLKQLAAEAESSEAAAAKVCDEVPQQPPVNPWTYMWDHIQADQLRSLSDMKSFIAKNMLRLYDENLCQQSRAFEVAQEMVSCLVLAGYSLGSLKHLVMQTPVDDILPPKDVAIVDKAGIETAAGRKKYLYHRVLDRLMRLRGQLPKLSDEQLEYLVRKCLLYIMRGCDKLPAPVRNSAGVNIVFNYLPPGLRELENKPKGGASATSNGGEEDGERMVIEEGDVPRHVGVISEEDKESTDPLNAILCPQKADVAKPNELPSRKYLLGCVHAEWVVLKGKPQIYEISVYMSDMSSLNVYTVPDDLQKQTDTMENLGFVANPDRHEFYFVQVGVGCVKALSLAKAVEKVAQFLEEKRHSSTSENKNNGLVLNFYSEEEMSIVLRAIESTGHKNLLLDIVKGFGCLEHFVDRNRSKKMVFSGPKLNIGGEDCFYHTEVRKGLQTSNLVSRTKGEALFQALEFFLDDAPGFKNYFQPNCFPSLSPRADSIKKRLLHVEEMYHLEVYIAAELKNQGTNLFLEGVFQPRLGKDLRDKPTIVASRVCRMLVEAGFDKGNLAKCFKNSPEFTINSSVFLDKMSISQRLKVTEQTMRCIGIIHRYFQPRKEENEEGT